MESQYIFCCIKVLKLGETSEEFRRKITKYTLIFEKENCLKLLIQDSVSSNEK